MKERTQTFVAVFVFLVAVLEEVPLGHVEYYLPDKSSLRLVALLFQ